MANTGLDYDLMQMAREVYEDEVRSGKIRSLRRITVETRIANRNSTSRRALRYFGVEKSFSEYHDYVSYQFLDYCKEKGLQFDDSLRLGNEKKSRKRVFSIGVLASFYKYLQHRLKDSLFSFQLLSIMIIFGVDLDII